MLRERIANNHHSQRAVRGSSKAQDEMRADFKAMMDVASVFGSKADELCCGRVLLVQAITRFLV